MPRAFVFTSLHCSRPAVYTFRACIVLPACRARACGQRRQHCITTATTHWRFAIERPENNKWRCSTRVRLSAIAQHAGPFLCDVRPARLRRALVAANRFGCASAHQFCEINETPCERIQMAPRRESPASAASPGRDNREHTHSYAERNKVAVRMFSNMSSVWKS